MASIVDIVEEVVAADVAAYGVGWPEKVPPPETVIPGDGRQVEIPGGARRVDPAGRRAAVTRRAPLVPVAALLVVALLVVGGILVYATHSAAPAPPPAASAASSAPTATASPSADPCAQAPSVAPISATFVQQTFSTTYVTTVSGVGTCGVTLQWGGPNCGTWSPQAAQPASGSSTRATMVWQHPHPPCDPTTDHSNVTVTLRIAYRAGSLLCSYQGAATGVGPACVKQ
ncbi:MAG: hypothetical protein KGJ98_08510 [Chloroflexota bacterium]|nr:hypothetical protein [Chloroflexota bacterium]MDE3102263.1 hypothetical protein [Chloroflexota bacterium]